MKHVSVKFQDEEIAMLKELQEMLQGISVAGKITQSDAIKFAVEKAYHMTKKQLESNKKLSNQSIQERYGVK